MTLSYDPSLRLYQVAGAATTRFAYDGVNMIAEYNGSNALQRRFVFGPGVDEPLVQYEGTGTTDRRFLHADERGSIVAISDGTGAMLSINKYDEFGKPQTGNSGRFQYTGQAWLPEVGLYYYKARMYAPHIGRFLQTDLVGYKDEPNLYAYVRNDPIAWRDPLGLMTPEECQDLQGESEGPVICGHKVPITYCEVAIWSVLCDGGAGAVIFNPPSGPEPSFGPAVGTPSSPTTPQEPEKQKPPYCSSRAYQTGQTLEAAGVVTKLGASGFAAFGVGEALYFGSMTGGPGASASIPTFMLAGTMYSIGGGLQLTGSAMKCSAGAEGSCNDTAMGAVSSFFELVTPLGPVAGLAASVTNDFVTGTVSAEVNPSDGC